MIEENVLEEVLAKAAAMVTRAGVPDLAVPDAFRLACDQLLQNAGADSVKSLPQEAAVGMSAQPPLVAGDGVARLSPIGFRLGVELDQVDSVYFLDGDRLEILVSPTRFPTMKSRATEQIALLVAAGRQAMGIDDEWTSVDPIRQQCEHFKRFDSSNFAATIKGMDDVFTVRGNGRDRKVRMTAPAWHRAAELVQSFATY